MNTVYLLKDPRTLEPRYVGITSQPLKTRLRCHRNDKRKNHRGTWIRSLYKLGLNPIVEILEECEDDQREDSEKAWILGFKQAGADLVNSTDGGEGTPGIKFTDEHRAKLSVARMRIPKEKRKEMSSDAAKSRIGYHHTQETIESIRSAQVGKKRGPQTEEWKEKRLFRLSGQENIEHCRQMANLRKGKPRPKSERKKLREGQLRRWAKYRGEI